MSVKYPPKRFREVVPNASSFPEIGLCAIIPSKKKEVAEFIDFILGALERNSHWLNDLVSCQQEFQCILLTGAGPNRFQLHEIIYPAETKNINFDIVLRGSEDHDKIALAAVFKLSNGDMNTLMKYIKGRMFLNNTLKQDLLKGNNLGITFAMLRPISEGYFRIMERIQIGSSLRTFSPKKRREERSGVKTVAKRARRVA